MTDLLQKAFDVAAKLPPEEQDVLAERLLTELEEEDAFDRAIAATAHRLVGLADEALAEHRTGKTEELR